jgi:hypothetical protein
LVGILSRSIRRGGSTIIKRRGRSPWRQVIIRMRQWVRILSRSRLCIIWQL